MNYFLYSNCPREKVGHGCESGVAAGEGGDRVVVGGAWCAEAFRLVRRIWHQRNRTVPGILRLPARTCDGDCGGPERSARRGAGRARVVRSDWTSADGGRDDHGEQPAREERILLDE